MDGERVWALEDCRHVAGSFERFLIARGERVLRVPTKLMADSRRAARTRGKSDSIDAIAVARAALREGIETLPAAHLDGPELDLRLLVDHRERLVRQRVGLNNTLQWHLHDLWPELELPGGALFSTKWSTRIGRRLARAEQSMRVRIARDELRRLRELTASIHALESRDRAACRPSRAAAAFRARVRAAHRGQAGRRDRRRRAASLLTPSSPGPAGSRRSRSARARPTATGSTAAATARSTPRSTASRVTRARCHPETRDYIARKLSEGKTHRDAIRSLKRHLTRRIWHLLQPPAPIQDQTITPTSLT